MVLGKLPVGKLPGGRLPGGKLPVRKIAIEKISSGNIAIDTIQRLNEIDQNEKKFIPELSFLIL